MRINKWVLVIFVLTSVYSVGQCSGDCQPGVIDGPYTASQTAENTVANLPQCSGSLCTTASWNEEQIEGIDAQQNIGTANQFFDQVLNLDTNIAVGPTVTGANAQILQWVDWSALQAFDKVTGQAIYGNGTVAVPGNATNLWSNSTQPECRSFAGNVEVIYDRLDNVFAINRRVTYAMGAINYYALCIAVSSGGDLTNASWYAYEFKLDTVIPCLPSSANCTTGTFYYYYPDWPRIGTWSNGFYVAFDLIDPTDSYYPAGFEACQLDRADMVLGQPATPMTCYTYMIPEADEPSLIHSVDVGDIDSPTGPPNAEPEYFLSIVNPSNAQQGSNGQGYCTSKTTPCTSNQLALFTWGTSGLTGPTFVTVNPYTPGCYDTSTGATEVNTVCVPVPSTSLSQIGAYGSPLCGDYVPAFPCLDSLGDRMANRLPYNNLTSSGSGPNGAYLTASHVVMESTSNERTGIRYYVLQVSNGIATVLLNSGSAGPPDLQDPNATLFYFMPSAALDKNGNLAIAYTTSGAHCSSCQTQYNPAVNVNVLPWKASSFNSPIPIVQGSGDQENSLHWGEYAATVIDPSDNLTFYGIGEYFNTSQTGTTNCTIPASNCYTWQTRIFRTQALPSVSVVPSSLTFGPQALGTISSPQTVTLTNTGIATLTLSNIGINGTNASDFAQTNNCSPTLAANENCQVNVTFTPSAVGSRSADLNITDNAAGSPQTVGLTGSVAVSLSPSNLTFPNQYVGAPGPPQTVMLTNTATTTLTITSVTASPADFIAKSSCGSSIASGASCSISVSFDPTASGARNGVLTVTDNGSDSPQTAALTGDGQDFAVAPSGSATATLTPGQTANYTVAVTPGGGFNKTVALSCSGAPPGSACSLSSSSVALQSSASASVSVAVTTAGTSASLVHPAGFPTRLALWLAFSGMSGLVLLGSGGQFRKRHGRLLYGVAFLCLLSLGTTFSACGGGSGSMGGGGTPAGTYDLTVTGTFTSGSATLTHSTKLTLVVQ